MIRQAAILALCLSGAPILRAGEVLDGLVATVNQHAILQSDWQDELRYECFLTGHALKDVTPQESKDALDRLVDQELLREQMSPSEVVPPQPEEVEKQIENTRKDFARGHPEQSWGDALSACQLTEADLKNHVSLEISQLRMVDFHLRPSIEVDAAAIEAYYNDHMAKPAAGGVPISLKEATPAIRELLTQQKINQSLSTWLESLRSQAQIKVFVPDSSSGQGPGQ